MTRTTTAQILDAAAHGRYAVPAVNIVDDLSTRAVCRSAQSARSPVILQTSVKTVRMLGADFLAFVVGRAAREVDVPVSLHLDHCGDRAVISECLEHGWSSVLFDASDRKLDDARTEMIEVVAEAHGRGAAVEAELENIAGVEDDLGADAEGGRYPGDVLKDFVQATSCDFFAPAVGTAHGMYKRAPRLDPQRAADLATALGVPLVLHGGTGLTREQFGAFIEAGCAKVNISTALKYGYMKSALAHLVEAQAADRWDPPSLFRAIGASLVEQIAVFFDWFGSAGKE